MTDKSKLLRHVELLVLKNKSGSDTAQVPSGATCYVYAAGATVSTATILYGTSVVPTPPPCAGDPGLRRQDHCGW